MRALVTGAGGFVGGWLCRALAERGAVVTGTRLGGADGAAAAPGVERWLEGDVRDADFLGRALDESRPDAVFHLAGVSSVGGAAADPGFATEVNVTGTVRLLAQVARRRAGGELDPVVLVVGSGEQYGRHDESAQPLAEGAEQRPLSVYAATKSAQEILALQAFRRDAVRAVCTRSFNHTGPGQGESFVVPALVRRALALRESAGDVLRLGNMRPVRDFAHVCDVVDAYIHLVERGEPGEVYNVCTGVGRSVREVAETVLERVGVVARLEEDPALVRPADVPVLVGDPAKLRERAGWAPRRTFEDCIDDLIHAAT
ncbi:MAG TPA: GDP-mannose 4,6-dehydratase [Gemmatimonadales bacterium]